MTLPPDMKARILQATRALPSQTRHEGAREAARLMALSLAAAVLLFFAFDPLHHGAGRPWWFLAGTFFGWVGVASWATWGTMRKGRTVLGGTRRTLVLIAAFTPAVLFAFMLAWNLVYPASLTAFPGRLGLKCFGLSLSIGACPLIAASIARRASDPVHPIAAGAALGAAAGAWSGVLVDLWCPAAYPSHIALGHILPILVLLLAGALLGKYLLSPPRDGPLR
jgi:hypothetical protein